MSKKVKKIVCIGGGNAMPKAVLSELKRYPVKISVISATLDSGGSAGRLRKEYGIISPGDIRRSLIALADTSPAVEKLFDFRFNTGELKGHNFANLLITALELCTNDYEMASKELHKILNVRHEVLPATLHPASLFAQLENGKIIRGETNIDIPKHDGNLKIKKIFLRPSVAAYPAAVLAISKADAVIIGPGDLYSSLAQIILTEGMADALKKSKAQKIYICNLLTKYGETNNFSVEDFAREVEKLIGKEVDFVIYNNKIPDKKRLAEYKKEHPELLKLVTYNSPLNKKFFGADIITNSGPVVHDSKKLIKVIKKICRL